MYSINIENFHYQGSNTPALQNVLLNIKQGDFVGITGPTGAGKSTFIKCLNGLIPHFFAGMFAGEVTLMGKSIKESTVANIARHVGSVFDDPEAQLVALEVEQELIFGLENLAVNPEEMEQRIAYALQWAGITHLRHASTNELSGGQKQRLAIATALALRPKVLLLDEPTSELDPIGSKEIFQLLKQLNEEQSITIVVVEQKTELLARYVHQLLVMDGGTVVCSGPPAEVFSNWQQMQQLGVKVPQITELACRLMKNDFPIPLTVAEGVAFINRLVGEKF